MKKIVLMLIFSVSFFLTGVSAEEANLTMKDAVYQALKNNLDLQIQIIDRDSSMQTLKINESIFIPQLTAKYSTDESNRPTTDIFGGADVSNTKRTTLSIGIDQKIPFGGNVNFTYYSSRTETNSKYSTINPSIYTYLQLNLQQPLLKGFGISNTKKEIYIASNNLKISSMQFQEKVLELIYNVEDAYCSLVYAYKDLEAKKKSLASAKNLLRQNEVKVKVGTAAPIDILEAKAEVANYESQVIQSEQSILTAEENLKKILNISIKNKKLIPTDIPYIKKDTSGIDNFILEALKNRPDVKRAKLDLKNYNIRVKYAKNQLLPELNIEANYYALGQGGDMKIFSNGGGLGGDMVVVDVISRNVWDALNESLKNKYKNHTIGLNLKIPLNFKKEKAEYAIAKLNLKKSLLRLKNTENTVYSEVKDSLKSLQTNMKLVDANKARVELEEEKLKAEIKKMEVGISTNYDVLIKQRDYANAQSSLLQSLKNYYMAVAKTNKVLGRTFKEYNLKLKTK